MVVLGLGSAPVDFSRWGSASEWSESLAAVIGLGSERGLGFLEGLKSGKLSLTMISSSSIFSG